jgi:hypothetical protein
VRVGVIGVSVSKIRISLYNLITSEQTLMSGVSLNFKLKKEFTFNRHTDLVCITFMPKDMFLYFFAGYEVTLRPVLYKNRNVILCVCTAHCYSYSNMLIYSNCSYKNDLNYKYL